VFNTNHAGNLSFAAEFFPERSQAMSGAPDSSCCEDYLHSSAKYYIVSEQGFYTVTDYMLLEDIDLTKVNAKV